VSKPSELNTVLKLIPKLNPKEQLEIKQKLDFLLQGIKTHPNRPLDDWLTEGIVTELVRRGLLHKGMDWKRVAPSGYQQQSESIRTLLKAATRRPLTAGEQYALGRLVARALADYLQNTPGFGLKVMLQNISKVSEALENSYPGYLVAGMLGMLIKVK
jgi:hypothetical protein